MERKILVAAIMLATTTVACGGDSGKPQPPDLGQAEVGTTFCPPGQRVVKCPPVDFSTKPPDTGPSPDKRAQCPTTNKQFTCQLGDFQENCSPPAKYSDKQGVEPCSRIWCDGKEEGGWWPVSACKFQ